MQVAEALIITILAQSIETPPVSEGSPLGIESAFDFLIKGGWAMIPIALCSLVALTIIVERMMVLRKGRVIPRGRLEHLKSLSHDRARALEYCRAARSPITNILEVAIKEADEPRLEMEKHVEEAGGREVVALRRRMRVLSSLPQVATMLGLLGTVFGMIKTFQAVAATSEALGKTEMLATGIFEAWTCTAAGLIVAVPVLVAYHHLMSKIDSLVADIDGTVSDWLEQQKSNEPGALKGAVESRRAAVNVARDDESEPVPAVVASA